MRQYLKPAIVEDVVCLSDTAIASNIKYTCYYCIDGNSSRTGSIPSDLAAAGVTTVIWDCEGDGDTPACDPLY